MTESAWCSAGHDQASRKKHKHDDLPLPAPKRKRVSFGGQLSPELFDKRLPPNSPLRRGATPGRCSLDFSHEPHSLLRRASTIGLMVSLEKGTPILFKCTRSIFKVLVIFPI